MSTLQSLYIDSEVVLDAEVLAEIAEYLAEHPITSPLTHLTLTHDGVLHRSNGVDQHVAERYVMFS